MWNGWSKADELIQLAEFLHGKALHEWNLLTVRTTRFYTAVKALHDCLEPSNKVLAGQYFRPLAFGR